MPNRIKVWDPLVRIGHWALVISVAVAWYTREGDANRHEIWGYAALAIVAIRVVWGLVGPHYARFTQFIRSSDATLGYARLVLKGREPRHLGHNPLGGWMIVLLLITISLVGFSGWLYTTDSYWGVKWVGELHEVLSDMMLALIALHIAGVIFVSYRHRENLVASMLHGRKRDVAVPGDDQITTR